MSIENDSLAALESFRSATDGLIGSYSLFNAEIIYKFGTKPARLIRERAQVSLIFDRTQFTHGRITIIETGELSNTVHYLGFSPQFQKYECVGTTLRISGNGLKIGKYEDTISPVL